MQLTFGATPYGSKFMQRAFVAAAFLMLAACSKDKEVDPPAELTEFSSTLRVQRAWTASVGGDDSPLRLGLGLSVEGDRVYAAGHEGDVGAFDLNSGKQIWRARTRAKLAGGTGAGTDLVAVGTNEGEVIALNTSDGAIRWRVKVNGEVLSAPAISPQAVVVRTVDGKLHGLSPADGRLLWDHEEQVPRLTLRGTSRPVIQNEVALCGFDNGKVVAVNLRDGSLVWETAVAPPTGRTELERLVDIDSAARVSGNDVYTVGFQGRVAMLTFDTGQVWWSHEASSYRGLGLDNEAMYVSTSDGEVVSLRRRTGAEIWRQNALLHRGLSAPAVQDTTVAVADFQGYVHWFDKATGTLAARASSGDVRVTNAPVAVGDMVLVINDVGRITAFRTSPMQAPEPRGKRKQREAAPPAPESEAAPNEQPGTAEPPAQPPTSESSAPSQPSLPSQPSAPAQPGPDLPSAPPSPDTSDPSSGSQSGAEPATGESQPGAEPQASESTVPRVPRGPVAESPDARIAPSRGTTPRTDANGDAGAQQPQGQ
jgi:outer membrane protein assembly factor BamB